MQESVFKDLLQQKLILDIHVLETLPSKGKPAQKKTGSKTVWIVKFFYGEQLAAVLEATRGGPREWASLDSLSNWLRTCGGEKFQVKYLSEHDRIPQESFEFVNTI